MRQPWMIPDDLAPGDTGSLDHDWSAVELHSIETADDPYFPMAFGALWTEFAAAREIEEADVLRRRLQWNPATLQNGCALCYRLCLVTSREKFAAVRDHTAIVRDGRAVVHLSHNLVAAEWRRSGLAGWMRALPLQTARTALAAQRVPTNAPITLVGEMEPIDPANPERLIRLKAYEKAGFLKIDPRRVKYLQPDFRPPADIDASGGPQPVSFSLIVRRVGREQEKEISGSEVRDIVETLYRMYAVAFRASDMAPLFASLVDYPKEHIALLPPTEDFLS